MVDRGIRALAVGQNEDMVDCAGVRAVKGRHRPGLTRGTLRERICIAQCVGRGQERRQFRRVQGGVEIAAHDPKIAPGIGDRRVREHDGKLLLPQIRGFRHEAQMEIRQEEPRSRRGP